MSLITMTGIQILLGCQYKLNIKHNVSKINVQNIIIYSRYILKKIIM